MSVYGESTAEVDVDKMPEKPCAGDDQKLDDERAPNKNSPLQNFCHYKGPVPGDDDFDENNAPVELVVNEWAQGTSIHGVPYITDSQQWRIWKRGIWIILVLVSTSFMIWQMAALITQYRNFDVITDTQTVNAVSLDFPEVTVCNSNMYSRSLQEATGITEPKTNEEVLQISPPRYINRTWFNGIEIDTEQVWKPKIVFGLCWTFNTDMKLRRPGYYAGLKFWMDLNQDDFENATELAGGLVWTLQPGTVVSVHKTVSGAKPGKEVFLGMDLTEHLREKQAPWARCKGEAPTYTQFQCRDDCFHAYIRENCQCRELQDMTDLSFPICERSGEDATCKALALSSEDEILSKCDCDLPPCYELSYQATLIEVDASKNAYTNMANAYNKSEDYVRNNFIAVTVNFKSMQYNRLTESKGMSFSQLLGAIGGSMGFFLGISLVSVFELVGDLVGMRLIPRLYGHKNLYGVGSRYKLD
mmetsp:Transcript_23870/g.66242  ORF Transcript_23870/g.66242 Transcript_23870/m.66242 type:complete len:472 (+) Transcript_23870:59-1474(+)